MERMENRIAEVHQAAEEKRASARAKKGEDVVRAEESAAKYKLECKAPRRSILMCFGA